MKKYQVSGTYRLIGAIGKMVPFCHVVQAENIEAAKDFCRDILYLTHEHILIKEVKEIAT